MCENENRIDKKYSKTGSIKRTVGQRNRISMSWDLAISWLLAQAAGVSGDLQQAYMLSRS